MEGTLDFHIGFKNIRSSRIPEILKNKPSQETEYYVEITRNGKKAYQCADPDCGKIYRFKSEVNRHVIIHQDERPYICSFNGCKKAFKRPETLEDHIRIHEGSLPFPCEEPGCERRFASKSALRYHQLMHKNNREYKCDIEGCEKSFLTMSQLKQHQKASGLHNNQSELSEDRSYKLFKSETESNASETVVKSESIQWEMKTQIYKKASPEENMQESYEMIMSVLVENRHLKEKLSEHEKSQVSPAKKGDHFNFQYTNSVLDSDKGEPSGFFDCYELKLLDFLKQ